MTGLWLVSYCVLWALVVIMSLLLVGVLRQLGMQQPAPPKQPSRDQDIAVPAMEDDGPPIGFQLPNITGNSINGFGEIRLSSTPDCSGPTLLMFISPMCESCQHLVEPFNVVATDKGRGVRCVAIVKADEPGCDAFSIVFPLQAPLICDHDRSITRGFGVHRSPFGLLYDRQGMLIRKGVIHGREELLALLGDTSVSSEAQAHIVPVLRAS